MPHMSVRSLWQAALLCLAAAPLAAASGQTPAQDVKLYALDCGRAHVQDMAPFSDTGELDGKPADMSYPCFLIRHGSDWLLWDTGLGDAIAREKNGVELAPGARFTVPVTLVDQLKRLDLEPGDIQYLSFSHFHFDHTGNANLFGASTWLINARELEAAEGAHPPFGVEKHAISAHKTAKVKPFTGDYDVFGDGTVTILATPGHTPGHQSLMVRLRNSGILVLSGDVYHQRLSREQRLVPAFNWNRADSLASMARIERLIENTKARLVIQHASEDFGALPPFPAYLD